MSELPEAFRSDLAELRQRMESYSVDLNEKLLPVVRGAREAMAALTAAMETLPAWMFREPTWQRHRHTVRRRLRPAPPPSRGTTEEGRDGE